MGIYRGSQLWKHHPHVRTGDELTFGERAADVMRNVFGSWAFVGSFLGFMAVWMTANSLFLRAAAFDKYPYILLNLSLSMMAGLQGALILIAAKRADRVSAEQAMAHYLETGKIDKLLADNTDMTAKIHEQTKELTEIRRLLTTVTCEPGSCLSCPPEK